MFLCIKVAHLIHYLQPIFTRHLEIEQQNIYWSDSALVGIKFAQGLANYVFNNIDSFLAVDAEIAVVLKSELLQLVFQHFDVDKLIVSCHNFEVLEGFF